MLAFLLYFHLINIIYINSLSHLIKLPSYSANGVFVSCKDFKNKLKKKTT